MRNLRKSQELWERARRVIPGGTQTLSKGADQFVQGVAPIFLERGKGSHIWDVDGNEYVDYMMALGPVVLGYAHPEVNAAVCEQMAKGMQFSLSHPIELEVADLLTQVVPCAEMVRFGKNGSDVTAGAIRLARAATGRDLVAVCGYHGWQDWFIGTTSRNLGVPASTRLLTHKFRYNHPEDLEALFAEHPGSFAAVILEPIHGEEPRDGFLQRVSALARSHGAVLVFDEVKTGFRSGLGGAQAYFGITPDLACFGKAIANGMPLSALVGRRDIMSQLDQVFFSFTAGGETLSLAAALATVRILRETDALERIRKAGTALRDGYNSLAEEAGLAQFTRCAGLPAMTVTSFRSADGQESALMRSLFQQEMLDRGILYDDGHVLCSAHSEEDVDRTLEASRAALATLRDALSDGKVRERIRGIPIQPLFL
jgi:glutamate-1-semialdehyde aminotransferase